MYTNMEMKWRRITDCFSGFGICEVRLSLLWILVSEHRVPEEYW